MKSRLQTGALVTVLLSGFLAGTALPELFRMGTGDYAGFMSLYSFRKYGESAAAPAARLLPYIVSGRIQTLLFLWMSSYTAAGLLFHLVYAWWLAASAGMLLALFLLRGGYEGILLFLCCLFPQWLLYGSVWQREFHALFRRRRYSGAGNAAGMLSERRRDLRELAGMAGLCLLGCCAEAFLGMWTLRVFLQLSPGIF